MQHERVISGRNRHVGGPRRGANLGALAVQRDVGLLPARARERDALGTLCSRPIAPVRPLGVRIDGRWHGRVVHAVLDEARDTIDRALVNERVERVRSCLAVDAWPDAPTLLATSRFFVFPGQLLL